MKKSAAEPKKPRSGCILWEIVLELWVRLHKKKCRIVGFVCNNPNVKKISEYH